MRHLVNLISHNTYLHAIITGRNSRETVKAYLEEVRLACLAGGFTRVLIEERLEGPRLDTLDTFGIAEEGAGQAHGLFRAIAYVDTNAEGNLMHFAETVAINRGLPVRVFASVEEAENWLSGQ